MSFPLTKDRHLGVDMPQIKGLGWVLRFIKPTWLPLVLAVIGRWLGSALQVLSSSLLAYVIVQLGKSDQEGVILPEYLIRWIQSARSPIITSLLLALGVTVVASVIDMLVSWTQVWVHLIVNKLVTPQAIAVGVKGEAPGILDSSTAVQRWLLKTDLVYLLQEGIAATIGNVGTITIILGATYRTNPIAGHVSLLCLLLWLGLAVPLTIKALRASRQSAFAHEVVGRVIRDGIALRHDLSRPSLKDFWVRRSQPEVGILQKAIARQGLLSALLEGSLGCIARVIPLAAVLAAVQTGSVGSSVAILLYLSRLAGPLGGLAGILPWMQRNLISVQRMFDMMANTDRKSVAAPSPYPVRRSLSVTGWKVRVGEGRSIEYPDFTASNEHILCVVGASGSGKSTLLKALAGQQWNESGEIRLDDKVVDPLCGFWQETCIFVPQEPELLPGTIKDNLDAFPNWKLTEARSAAVGKVLAATNGGGLCHVGIDDKGVSVGQRRAIAVLRSLGTDAQIVLLDEPLAGVDGSIVSVLKAVFEEARSEGRVLIMTAHEHDFERLDMNGVLLLRIKEFDTH